jgi:hypothetical protein
MNTEWHSTVKKVATMPVAVMAPVEVADEHRAVVVEAKAMVKDAAVATHDQLR